MIRNAILGAFNQKFQEGQERLRNLVQQRQQLQNELRDIETEIVKTQGGLRVLTELGQTAEATFDSLEPGAPNGIPGDPSPQEEAPEDAVPENLAVEDLRSPDHGAEERDRGAEPDSEPVAVDVPDPPVLVDDGAGGSPGRSGDDILGSDRGEDTRDGGSKIPTARTGPVNDSAPWTPPPTPGDSRPSEVRPPLETSSRR